MSEEKKIDELFGDEPPKSKSEKKRREALAALALEQEAAAAKKAEEAAKAKELDRKNREDTKIVWKTQFHPCSYCGGFKHKYIENPENPQSLVVVGFEIPVPAKDKEVAPYVVCHKCVTKLFNTLGSPLHYGHEMEKLTGQLENKGFMPTPKVGRI